MNRHARIVLSAILLVLAATGQAPAVGIEGAWSGAKVGVEIRREGDFYYGYYTRVTANMKANGAARGDLGWELRAEEGGESYVGRIKAWGLRGPGFRWLSRFRITLNGDTFEFQWYRDDGLTIPSSKYRYTPSEESAPRTPRRAQAQTDPPPKSSLDPLLDPEEAEHALLLHLENRTREFLQVYSEQRYDSVPEYLVGEMLENFLEFREGLERDPDMEQWVPVRWSIIGSRLDDFASDASDVIVVVDVHSSDERIRSKMVWREVRGGWKISGTEPIGDDEELDVTKHLPLETVREIRKVLDELTPAFEALDAAGILAHVTGEATQDLADMFGSERAREEARERFFGTWIHILSIEPGEGDEEVIVSVTVEHKGGEDNIDLEWLFKPVRGKWKLARELPAESPR